MKTAVAYSRVSGKGQVDGHGFERQEEEVRTYCKREGLNLIATYREEGVSGVTDETDRPAFQSMIADLLANGCRTVIVEGLDRLARELRIQEALLAYLAAKGVTLISARTGENVTEALLEDPMRAAMVRMQGVFSQLEKELLVKKLRKSRQAKAAATGKCEGRKPVQESCPEAWKLIKKLRGAQVKYVAIANELNTKGIMNSVGKPWTASSVQSLCHRNGI